MKLFISHQSALEFWRKRRKLPGNSADRRCNAVLPSEPARTERLVFLGLALPVHIVLGSQETRRLSPVATQHVFSAKTPIGCFMNIGNGVMVSSPEFCFLQMASQLTLIELIELGYELCGVYSLPLAYDKEVPECGFYQRKQLTGTRKLKDFLGSMTSVKACEKAQRAVRYIQDNSASPMETKLAMLMTLPYKLGGYGFKTPQLNYRITLSKTAKRYFTKDYYVCDLYWPDEKVAVEYDSDMFHTGSERIANDSNKRNALALQGIQVVSVTRRQLYRFKELEGATKTIAKHLGKRLFPKKGDFATVRLKLRKQLL